MDADQIQPELDKDAPRRSMERLVRQLSDGWNHLSASLVGMPISDPRWKPAVDWLNENRQLLATMRKLQTPVKPQPTTPQHTMSTTTQRPTPETDQAWAKWPYAGPGVHANFARKLERERDEAREQIEAMREAIKGAHRALTDVELRGQYQIPIPRLPNSDYPHQVSR